MDEPDKSKPDAEDAKTAPGPAKPLIVNQNRLRTGVEKPLPYRFGSETYDLFNNSRGPFEERALAGLAKPVNLEPAQTAALFRSLREARRYQLAYPNERSPHAKRKVAAPAAPAAPSRAAKFTAPGGLREHSHNTAGAVRAFFRHALSQLREEPRQFPALVNAVARLFVEAGLRVKVWDAYRTFADWDDFMRCLEAIAEDHEIENFELFCSALFGFYSQFA